MIEKKKYVVVAIDPGESKSGIVTYIDGIIEGKPTTLNEEVIPMIREYLGAEYKLRVVVEDVRAYSGQMTPNTVETIKFIGELRYRLKAARIAHKMPTRSNVRKWVFNTFPEQVLPLIMAKIAKKGHINKDGQLRKASFVYVDDRIVIEAMRERFSLPASKGRKGNMLKISTHAWQSLALLEYFISGALESDEITAKNKAILIAASQKV